jgi:hypothetical protein
MRIPDWLLHALVLAMLGAAISTWRDVQVINARLIYAHGEGH